MTTLLHLGVIDMPYSHATRSRRAKKVASGTQTTGDVAGFLEDKYHVMENFYQLYSGRIAREMEEALKGALENMLVGGPAPTSPYNEATDEIENLFKRFLDKREIEKIGYRGIPTQAALDGVNHRLKHPYSKKNKPRPSFIDTGLYQSSFKAWAENK